MSSDKAIWLLYTDGSGHQDGFGGCAWIAFNGYYGAIVGAAANSSTSVNRMELLAAVNGLAGIREVMSNDPELEKQFRKVLRPRVTWYCDRQSLVRAVTRAPGCELYGREVDADLWAAFAEHEKRCDIEARHVDRNKIAAQALCDKLAGSGRAAIKHLKEKLLEISEYRSFKPNLKIDD